MTSAHATSPGGDGPVEVDVDVVYFLMFPGWRSELRSNRWHYASRWAQHVPVVLIQPQQVGRPRAVAAEPDPRIANCSILPVAATLSDSTDIATTLVQSAQVMEHMRGNGFHRPLLWCYNPRLVGLYAALPAVARVYHASENYFDFDDAPFGFVGAFEQSLRLSDVVIAVSSGVGATVASRVPDVPVAIISNGCDTDMYRPSGPSDPEVAELRHHFARIAVFAGNINARLDLELTQRVASSNPSTVLVFAGPVSGLSGKQRREWAALRDRANVRYLGEVPVGRLPRIYRTADLGFIPYLGERYIVRNGFPLKALEMCATEMPVVSTLMEPLVDVAEALVVNRDADSFSEAFASVSREYLTPAARNELATVCSQNAYDKKFALAYDLVRTSTSPNLPPTTRVDDLLSALGREAWWLACVSFMESWPHTRTSRVKRASYSALGNVLPQSFRRRIPESVRARVRRWVTAG